jgi:predicted CoA-substrate-specific enzyme activase
MMRIGIDVGSTYTKYCVMDESGLIVQLWSERTPVRQKGYFTKKLEELRTLYPDCQLASCGYGKRNIDAVKSVTELTALSAGLNKTYPGIGVAVDIGGQDTKIIRQRNGKLKEFYVNDKCAAGSGMFLANVLSLLEMRFDDIDLTKSDFGKVSLTNVCAVFALTEIVELLSIGTDPQAIINSAIVQILKQASALVDKIDYDSVIALSGGLSQIRGFNQFASLTLKREVLAPNNAQYLGAIGCAELLCQI